MRMKKYLILYYNNKGDLKMNDFKLSSEEARIEAKYKARRKIYKEFIKEWDRPRSEDPGKDLQKILVKLASL